MLQLNIESAPYSESDFPQFNPEGYQRVLRAVEMARQSKVLAQNSEDLREATAGLRAAGDIRNAEQRIAQRNFEEERGRTFGALRSVLEGLKAARLPAPRRLEVENRLDHLITLFNLKDFAAVHKGLAAVHGLLKQGDPRARTPRRASDGTRQEARPPSLSSLLRRGESLERAGRAREAVEIYGQILGRDPQHFQARKRLQQLAGERYDRAGERGTSWARRYRRYGR